MEGGAKDEDAQPVRKRRNRWDDDSESAGDIRQPDISADVDKVNTEPKSSEDTARKRKSRWGGVDTSAAASSNPIASEEVIQQTLVLKLQLQQVTQKLITVAQDAVRIEQDPNRSPSPPPRYDSTGKRTNTREMRMRDSLNQQRTSIIEQLIKLNPTFQPPADFVRGRPSKKIYIPKHPDPNYNYIGLIIGPRGNTQKQMEQDTGCKISIRGKGSAKDGSKNRANKQPDEDDELHVYISGDSMENVEKAAKMIEVILKPMDDNVNEHKQKQLRELALINGTLREDEYCPVCGEKGHRQFECPYRAKAFKAAGVKCSICGDLSHPTRDCPLKLDAPSNANNLDSEYDSFLAELDGKKPQATTSSSAVSDAASSGSAVAKNGNKGPTVLQPIIDMFSNKAPPLAGLDATTAASVISDATASNPIITPAVAIPAVPTVPVAPVAAAASFVDPSSMYAYSAALGYPHYLQYAAYYGYAGMSTVPNPAIPVPTLSIPTGAAPPPPSQPAPPPMPPVPPPPPPPPGSWK